LLVNVKLIEFPDGLLERSTGLFIFIELWLEFELDRELRPFCLDRGEIYGAIPRTDILRGATTVGEFKFNCGTFAVGLYGADCRKCDGGCGGGGVGVNNDAALATSITSCRAARTGLREGLCRSVDTTHPAIKALLYIIICV
jgi:hypothetical protein